MSIQLLTALIASALVGTVGSGREPMSLVEIGFQGGPEDLLLGVVPGNPGPPDREPDVESFGGVGRLSSCGHRSAGGLPPAAFEVTLLFALQCARVGPFQEQFDGEIEPIFCSDVATYGQ